jgi:O-antigen ligase
MPVLFLLLSFATVSIALPGRWPAAVLECGSFVLLAVVAARNWWNARPWPVPGIAVALVLACSVGLAQLLAGSSIAPWETANATLRWASWAALVLAAAQLLDGIHELRRFLQAMVVLASLLAISCLLQPVLELPGYDRFAGPFQNRNTYAGFIELALPAAAWLAHSARRLAWLWWAATALMAASVAVTGSRAGSLLVCTEFVGLLIATRQPAICAGAFLLAAVWVTAAGIDTLVTRLRFTDPFDGRREMLDSALSMAYEKPWLGFGLGSFQEAYPGFATVDFGKIVNHVHNDWVEWALEGGLFLPLALAAALAHSAGSMRRHWWAAGTLVVAVHALVDYPFARSGLAAWVWVLAAVTRPSASRARAPRESILRSGRSSATATR